MQKKLAVLSLICFFVLAVLVACSATKNSVHSKHKWFNSQINYGSLTDSRDGQIYRTVQIGSQTWMAQNLNYVPVPAQGKKAKRKAPNVCFDRHASNCVKYGGLYGWDAAKVACPDGWHLPDSTEWDMLFATVGKDSAAKVLKSAVGWLNKSNGLDSYGFSVRPVGWKNRMKDEVGNRYAFFWTSTEKIDKDDRFMEESYKEAVKETFGENTDYGWEIISLYAYGVIFSYNGNEAGIDEDSKSTTRSIRCLKNAGTADSLTATKDEKRENVVPPSSSSSTDASSPSTVGRGSMKSETVQLSSMTDPRDGKTYKTVQIGSQTWMAENLNHEMNESYCLEDDKNNCIKYGRLYTWKSAMESCPAGWHLPTQAEWDSLMATVGGQNSAMALKSAMDWRGNGNGSDSFGFSALPAGFRFSDGTFSFEGENAFFWSSAEVDSNLAFSLNLFYYSPSAELGDDYKNLGLSVRCLKGELEKTELLESSSSGKSGESSSSVVPPSSVIKGTLLDPRDGQTYKTVTIGSQTWMAENLNFATENSHCSKNKTENCAKYGRLYSWAAAIDSIGLLRAKDKECGYDRACSLSAPVQGVCPAGWHLPSIDEWNSLGHAVGLLNSLKSQTGWFEHKNGTDDYGFSVLPAGDNDYDGIFVLGYDAAFWSSSEEGLFEARYMDLNQDDFNRNQLKSISKARAFSVRCVQDVVWLQAKNESSQPVFPSERDSIKAPVSPSSVVRGSFVDSRDGQTYKTVTIGMQTWMAQNLNYETKNSECYDGKTDMCSRYGHFYKRDAAKEACPIGWHLPSEAEWDTLISAVGGSSVASKALRFAAGWWKNGSDDYGFTAIPVVRSYRGEYRGYNFADYWTSTDSTFMRLSDENKIIKELDKRSVSGMPIRCVQDRRENKDESRKTKDEKSVIPTSTSSVIPASAPESMIDSRDGQTYKTVKIGSQTWMAQNLNYATAGSYCHEDIVGNCAKYARLYNAYAIEKACPAGWHLPSETEWNALFSTVGGDKVAGKKLKAARDWLHDGGGTDDYGFSVLPTSQRDEYGKYSRTDVKTCFWTSTKNYERTGSHFADVYLCFDYVNEKALYGSGFLRNGFSVRCVQNSNKVIKSLSSSSSQKKASQSSSSVASSSSVVKDSFTDARDGQTYKTVTIGSQTWMAQNLNFETADSYCYGDNASNCAKYGRLYTWAAAVNRIGQVGAKKKNKVRGVCPDGWHLPGDREWETLFASVGNRYVAGKKLRSAEGWKNEGNGTDEYEFSVLPGGFRNARGTFKYESDNAQFWTSSENNDKRDSEAYYVIMYGGIGSAYLEKNGAKTNGLSVRCLKD